MLTFDSGTVIRSRTITYYMEFNYMILQAYDFYQLLKNNNCILQIGGSDQWGNIVNGVDLKKKIRKRCIRPNISINHFGLWRKMGKLKKEQFG